MKILAIDPGATAGVAIVEDAPRGHKPRLIAATTIKASRRGLWSQRLSMWLTDNLTRSREDLMLVIEDPQPQTRKGKAAVDTWTGLGRYQGLVLGWWFTNVSTQAQREPKLIRQRAWCEALRVPTSKRGDGTHRLAEARLHLSMAPSINLSVDAAEAALLGCAVARGLVKLR